MEPKVCEFLLDAFDWVVKVANSNFSTALLGALAGAVGAQFIAERSSERKRLLEEIRCTNAASVVAFDLVNTFCILKAQYVRSLKDTYVKQSENLAEFKQKFAAQGQQKIDVFEFVADFRSLPTIAPPIGILRDLLFEKLSLTGRPLSLVATLSQVCDALEKTIQKRNHLIENNKLRGSGSDKDLADFYFGQPNSQGHIDTTYKDCVEGISSLTDDCIFFSRMIGEDLYDHGQQLIKTFGSKAPPVHRTHFDKAAEEGLLPDPTNYQDWMNFGKPGITK